MKKKQGAHVERPVFLLSKRGYQYIPPMSGAGAAGAFGSGMSVIAHSVVRSVPATLAAFLRAEQVTFAGSIIPASSMFTHLSRRAS